MFFTAGEKLQSHYSLPDHLLTLTPAFDAPNLLLYVNLTQIFRLWFIPFHKAPVNLITVLKLQLNKEDGKYYIASQNDLYQTDQWVRFFPFSFGLWFLVWVGQIMGAVFSLLGAMAFWPITLIEESSSAGAKEFGDAGRVIGIVDEESEDEVGDNKEFELENGVERGFQRKTVVIE